MLKAHLPMGLLLLLATAAALASAHPSISSVQENICATHCDGRDPAQATNPFVPVTAEIWSRKVELFMSNEDNMGYGQISNGDPGDQVWLDRSFDGGLSWNDNSKLGETSIPEGSRGWRTLMFNVDGAQPVSGLRIGALRACGKAGDRDEIACTPWVRTRVMAANRVDAAATALMQFYNDQGLWTSTGWWNAANCLTAIIDYTKLTGNRVFESIIDNTFEKNRGKEEGDFTNMYVDDTGWWGLAWVDAYDLTGQQKYLDMAKIDSDFMYATKDDKCGGGVWWTTRKDYKNAIPNELFIKLAAALHNRLPGDTKFLTQAIEVWQWFEGSGMFNSDNLINDGLDDNCQNNGGQTWTYNQGVILGGLVELEKATGDSKYTEMARKIADAVLASPLLNPDNILREPCELGGGECGGDATTFKGVFIRNLGELNRHLTGRPYSGYLDQLANVIYERDRNSLDQYGVHWAGPFTIANAANQHCGLEVFTAAI